MLSLTSTITAGIQCPSSMEEGFYYSYPKGKDQEDSANSVNFRPIALTSCIGKLLSTILKNSLLNFVTSNCFLDPSTQKAFMPSVPSCIEHYAKLATALHEAHVHHKSPIVSWLDLANAYGNVHHDLISFSLHHYGVSDHFTSLVANFYSSLSASVYTHDWCSPSIPINKGTRVTLCLSYSLTWL